MLSKFISLLYTHLSPPIFPAFRIISSYLQFFYFFQQQWIILLNSDSISYNCLSYSIQIYLIGIVAIIPAAFITTKHIILIRTLLIVKQILSLRRGLEKGMNLAFLQASICQLYLNFARRLTVSDAGWLCRGLRLLLLFGPGMQIILFYLVVSLSILLLIQINIKVWAIRMHVLFVHIYLFVDWRGAIIFSAPHPSSLLRSLLFLLNFPLFQIIWINTCS